MNSQSQTWTPNTLPSSLARTLDPRVPSNLMILVFAPLVAIAMGISRLLAGMPLESIVIQAAGAGAFTGLAWVIGRELDPDHNLTAYVAAVLMGIALFIVEFPSLLSLAAIVVGLRIVNRSTGLRPRITDMLVLVALAAIATALDGLWLIGLVAALVFVLNAFLPDSNRAHNLLFALAALALSVTISALTGDIFDRNFALDGSVGLAAALISIVYLAVILRVPTRLRSVGDWTGDPLMPSRVLAGQSLALGAAVAFLAWSGTAGIIALLPVWPGMVGVVLRGLIQRKRR